LFAVQHGVDLHSYTGGLNLVKTNKTPLRVDGVNVLTLDAVRDTGVIFDTKPTMKNLVDSVKRSGFHQLRQLRSNRRSVTLAAAHTSK